MRLSYLKSQIGGTEGTKMKFYKTGKKYQFLSMLVLHKLKL